MDTLCYKTMKLRINQTQQKATWEIAVHLIQITASINIIGQETTNIVLKSASIAHK